MTHTVTVTATATPTVSPTSTVSTTAPGHFTSLSPQLSTTPISTVSASAMASLTMKSSPSNTGGVSYSSSTLPTPFPTPPFTTNLPPSGSITSFTTTLSSSVSGSQWISRSARASPNDSPIASYFSTVITPTGSLPSTSKMNGTTLASASSSSELLKGGAVYLGVGLALGFALIALLLYQAYQRRVGLRKPLSRKGGRRGAGAISHPPPPPRAPPPKHSRTSFAHYYAINE